MSDAPPEPILIPPAALSAEALQGVVEAFIAREGTDYGEVEWSLAEKTVQLRKQLESGAAVIVFDPLTESCTLLPRQELAALGVKQRS